MLKPLYINIWPFGQCSKGITNSFPFLIRTNEGHHLTSVGQNKIIHISTSNHSWHSVTNLISWKCHMYVTPKPSTKLLYMVLIYNGLGNVTILTFLEFVLYQSIVHPVQAIVLGLILTHESSWCFWNWIKHSDGLGFTLYYLVSRSKPPLLTP